MKEDTVEVKREYRGGSLVRKWLNGKEVKLLPIEKCQYITVQKFMSKEEVEKMYGGLRGFNEIKA